VAHSVLNSLRGEPSPEITRIGSLIGRLQDDPLWPQLSSLERARCFMEHHVWAVWDFMSLLKSLQAELAPARIPWVPPCDSAAARFINEIVVGEESDEGPDGRPASHFEIYIRAMEGAGARTQPILWFVADVARDGLTAAFEGTSLPSPVRRFVLDYAELLSCVIARACGRVHGGAGRNHSSDVHRRPAGITRAGTAQGVHLVPRAPRRYRSRPSRSACRPTL
jgi:Protein of unknown function (DUF3050)